MAYTPKFTTIEQVRRVSSFQNNPEVDDTIDILPKIQDAEGRILNCAAKYYVLPFETQTTWANSPAQGFISGLATDLASSLLLLTYFQGQGVEIFEPIEKKYNIVMAQLESFCSGEIDLIGSDGESLSVKTTNNSGVVSGFPNSIDDTDDPDDSGSKNTMDTTF